MVLSNTESYLGGLANITPRGGTNHLMTMYPQNKLYNGKNLSPKIGEANHTSKVKQKKELKFLFLKLPCITSPGHNNPR